MSHLPVEKGDILLIQEEFYKIVGDYTDVETPLNWELEHIDNEHDSMMVNTKQMEENLGDNWRKVKLPD